MLRTAPLFSLGFRPFYLLAALLAALAVPLWLAQYFAWIVPSGYLSGMAWHAHELMFGFVAAVLTGFLFTAVRNWTGLPTPTGTPLAALAALWLSARVLVVMGPGWLAAAVDVAFLPAVALSLWFPLRLHAARLVMWDPWSTRSHPIVWILHVSYAWIPLGLLLLGLATLTGTVPAVLADHALSVGAVSGMILGMITRTARGHTGQPLRAGSIEVIAYVSLLLSAAVRVLLPLAWPEARHASSLGSAVGGVSALPAGVRTHADAAEGGRTTGVRGTDAVIARPVEQKQPARGFRCAIGRETRHGMQRIAA